MRRSAMCLALAMTWMIGGWAMAQYPAPMPGEAVMPPPGQPGAMMPPPGAMMPPPGAMMPPPGAMMPPPGGPMGYSGMPYGAAMQGGYPGMPGVVPYPGAGDGCCGGPYGAMPYGGAPYGVGCCGDGCGGGDECCGCDAFGRHGGCGCGDCGCEGDGTPHWRAHFEALYMNFDLPGQPTVLTTNATGNPLLDIGGLDFDYELAGRLTLEARLCGDHSIEVSFFGMPRWTDSASVVGAVSSVYQQLNGAAVVPYDNGNQQDISYRSDFFNVECNYWMPIVNHRLFQASCMIGGRYLRVDEQFVYTGIDVIGGNTVVGVTDINAANDLFATQVGMMCWVPLSRKVSAKLDAKVGAAYNFAEQSTSITVRGSNVAAQNITYAENPESNKGAFLADFSGVVVTQINCNLAFYVGYQALWLDELVLAPEQFNSIFPTNGTRPVLIDDTGHRLYHGAVAGLEVTW